MEKVSIVIPTFNQIQYLPACIDHCLFQTYGNLEIIIVDGGSSDGTKEYLSSLSNEIKYSKVNPVVAMNKNGEIVRQEIRVHTDNHDLKIITFSEDIGPTRTYNKGLKLATGEYCTYIVGDDIPHPYMIEELVAAIEATNSDFVYSDMFVVDDQSKIIRQMKMPDYSFEACFAKWYHLGVSHLYRTQWHYKVGLMDESYLSANDYDHYLRFAMSGCKFHHVPKVLYSIRFHGNGRKAGQHTPDRYDNLIEESKKCAIRARSWLAQHKKN